MKDKEGIINASQETLRHILIAGSSLEDLLDDNFCNIIDFLDSVRGKLIFSGLGKSGYIAGKLVSTFNSLGIKAVFLHPSEAFHGDLGIVEDSDALIFLSNGGETHELLKLVNHLKGLGVKTLGIMGDRDSSLAKISDHSLIYQIDKEGSPLNIAPMASTVSSLILGYLLASAVSQQRGFTDHDFNSLHPGGLLGLKTTPVKNIIRKEVELPLVSSQQSFAEALQEIAKKGLGVTCVVDEGGLLQGILTDGDVRRFVLSDQFSLTAQVSLAMTKEPITITEESSLQEAIELMEESKITSLVVVDGNKPISIIHLHDIIENNII